MIKIIGIGSPFGDDQIGKEIIKILDKTDIKKSANLIYLDRPQFKLLDLIKNSEIVFLIDAVKSNSKIGTIHRLENEEIYKANTNLSTHGIGIAEVLQLGNALTMLPKKTILYGIEIGNVTGFDISNQLLNIAKNDLIKKLTEEITKKYTKK